MSIYPIVRIQLSFVQFSLLCYEFCILSKTECKSIYYHFRHDHESSSFQKLARNKWICRETCDFFRDQFTLLAVNSFRNRYYQHDDTALSKYIWKLKDLGKALILKWSIAAYASPYRSGTRRFDLCITEKYITAREDQKRLLNKRTQFISQCCHQNKFLLKNVK